MLEQKRAWSAIRVLTGMIMIIGMAGSLWLETEYPVIMALLFLVLFAFTYWDLKWHYDVPVKYFNSDIENLILQLESKRQENITIQMQLTAHRDALSSIAYEALSEEGMRRIALDEVEE